MRILTLHAHLAQTLAAELQIEQRLAQMGVMLDHDPLVEAALFEQRHQFGVGHREVAAADLAEIACLLYTSDAADDS